MGVGGGEQGGCGPPGLSYIPRNTDKLEGSLMVLFFCLVFPITSPPGKISAITFGSYVFRISK